MLHGLKTAKERPFVFGIPADPSIRGSFRATTPSAESTAGSVLGVGLPHLQLLLAVLHLVPHFVHQQVLHFEVSHIDPHLPHLRTVPTFDSMFGAGSALPAVSTSGFIVGKRPTPYAA